MADPQGLFPQADTLEDPLRQTGRTPPAPRPRPATDGLFPADPTDPLTQAVTAGAKIPPERAARVFQQQTRTGLSPDLIERNLEALEQQTAGAAFDPVTFARESPIVAEWLKTHPLHAALTADDLVPLTALERTLRFGSNSIRATGAGLVGNVNMGLWGAIEAVGDTLGVPSVAAYGKRLREEAAAFATRIRGPQTGAGPNERALYSGFESIGTAAPVLLSTVLTRNPKFALSLMGTQTGGQAYGQARDVGVRPGPALVFGASQGLVEAATEMFPMHLLVGDLAAKSGLLKTLAHQALAEVPGEEIATAVQDLNEWAALHGGEPVTSYLAQRPAAAWDTLLATLVTVGVQSGAVHTLNRAVTAVVGQRVLEDLGTDAKASKTLQRAPAQFAELLALATADGPLETLYAPVETWTTYWQSVGVDPAAKAAELTGDPDAYAHALEGGSDLAIPTASYVRHLAATEHHGYFTGELRVSEDAMNGRELKALDEQLRTAVPAEPLEGPPSTSPLRDAVIALQERGGMPRAVAEKYASLFAAVEGEGAFGAGGMAARAGVDPVAWFARYALTVTRPDLDVDTPQPAAQTEDPNAEPETPAISEDAGVAAGDVIRRGAGEQLAPVSDGGVLEGRGTGGGAQRRWVPPARPERPAGESGEPDAPVRRFDTPPPDELYTRRPLEENRARLTPEVHREVERILDELETFPYVARTWNWLEGKKTGNAAGGAADIVAGKGGAKVYNDILAYAPVNPVRSGRNKGKAARAAGGKRGTIEAAVRTLLELGDIHNNLAEGVVRVAERRAAGQWKDISPAELPPAWRVVALAAFTDDLTEAMEAALSDETAGDANLLEDGSAISDLDLQAEGDTSFNVDEFSQGLFDEPAPPALPAPVGERPPLAGPPIAGTWYHGSGAATADAGRDLVFLTDTREHAAWFATYHGDGTPTIREVAVRVQHPLVINGAEDAKALAALLTRAGVRATVTESEHGWLWDAPDVATVSPYDGDNPIDIVYLPQAVAALRAAGYDGFYEPADPLDNGSIKALVVFPPAPAVDVLETGETQPRLPGAEDVREQDVATPAFEAPFALTSEVAKPRKGRQTTLFQGPKTEPDGYALVAPYLTPEEKARLRSDHARKLVEVFRRLPPDVDFATAAVAGDAARGWYAQAGAALRAVFREPDAARVAGLLAALSPQTSVEINLRNTIAVWGAWTAAGRPTEPGAVRQLLERAIPGQPLLAWMNNAGRALTAADPRTIQLSGPKVSSFYRNLLGDADEVTNDSWMARFAAVDQKLFAGEIAPSGAPGKGPGVAARLTASTGTPWTPAEVQETIWSWAKTIAELGDSTGDTAEAIIRTGRLTDRAIRSTPRFDALLTADPAVRAILDGAGYGPQLDAWDAERRSDAGDRDAARADSRGERAAGDRAGDADRGATVTLSELRAARRLDRGRAGDVTEFDQSAFHGSPHKFDRFSLQAIGTGEGAQVYGWGLYFSSVREVADAYRENLAGKPQPKTLAYVPRPGDDIPAGDIYQSGGLYHLTSRGPEMTVRQNLHGDQQWYAVFHGEWGTTPYATREEALAKTGIRPREADAGRLVRGLNELQSRMQFIPAGPGGITLLREELERTITNYRHAIELGRPITLRWGDASSATPNTDREENLRLDRYRLEEAEDALFAVQTFGDRLEIRPPERPGRTYTVELPDDADFLSLDEHASEQSPKVQAALRALGVEWQAFDYPTLEAAAAELQQLIDAPPLQGWGSIETARGDLLRLGFKLARAGDTMAFHRWFDVNHRQMGQAFNNPTGQEIYRMLGRAVVAGDNTTLPAWMRGHEIDHPEIASRKLAAQGLAGMRYLDGASRAAGHGTQNYVVVDERLITITEFDQPARLTKADVRAWADTVRATIGPDLVTLDVDVLANGDLELATLAVRRGATGAGIGSRALLALTRLADANGARLVLRLAQRGDTLPGAPPTTSRGRLVRFYRRFGFVENRGRQADLSISASMYREPTLPTPGGERATVGYAVSDDPGALAAGDRPTGSGAVRTRDDAPGRYATTTALVTVAERTLGHAGPITHATDAAGALSYLARGAQERFDGLVVDGQGHPLGVIGAFKGEHAATHVHPAVLLAEALRLEGAAGVWFAHNHPSGSPVLSPEDLAMTDQLRDTFRDTGLLVHGLLAIGAGVGRPQVFQAVTFETGAAVRQDGEVPPAAAGPRVAVVERELTATGHLTATPIRSSNEALATVPRLLEDRFGVVLYNNTLHPIAVIPLDVAGAGRLREDGRLEALARALSLSGSVNAIVYTPEPVDDGTAENVAIALEAHGQRVLDIISGPTGAARSTSSVKGQSRFEAELLAAGKRYAFRQDDDGSSTRRGAIRFGPDRQFNIALYERADLSTFLHETGHFFLEVMGDLVDHVAAAGLEGLTPEQRGLLADYGKVLEWFGVQNRGDITVEHHERFARAFEAYLFEGVAPSIEMQGAFAAFRTWLMQVYRSLLNLKVNLTPEVRGVFDRLLASDRAIAEAEAKRGQPAMFLTPAMAGMTPEQFALYRATVGEASRTARERLDQKLLAEVKREQTAAWQAQRDEIEKDVAEHVHGFAVYRALSAMQRGTAPNGDPLTPGDEPPKPMKLSREILVARYGAERLATLPRPYIYTTDGGLDPEVVAELFGFSSGDAMLRQIAEAPPMSTAIGQETTRRMLEEHGALLLDGGLADQARAAVANDDRDRVIRAELKALHDLQKTVAPFVRAERQAGQRDVRAATQAGARALADAQRVPRGGAAAIRGALPPAAYFRDTARVRIAALPIRKIHPAPYWSASRRAAAEAIDHAARHDYDQAIDAKLRELLNLNLYREAERVLEEVDARVRRAKALARPAARARIGLAGHTYLDQIDGLLDRYDFAQVSQKTLDRRASLRKFAAALEGQGLPIDLPDEVLDEAKRVHYSELTIEEFLGVTDAIAHLVHIAQLKNRLLASADARDFAVIRDELAGSIRAKNRVKKPPLTFRRAEEKYRAIGDVFAVHRKMSDIVQGLDGYADGGPFWEAFMRPLNAAADAEETRLTATGTAYWALVESFYPGRELASLQTVREIPAIGASLTREERLAVALNWGNESSRQRMLNDPSRRWTLEQIEATLDTLDERDVRFVQATWDFVDQFWPEIAAKQERVTGLPPQKVEPVAWQTRFGLMRGGYYPLASETRLNPRAATLEAASQAKLAVAAAYVRNTTKRGHVQARKENVEIPVRLELGVVFQHFEQVIHDLTHHEVLIDVNRVLRDPDVTQAILDTAGDQVYKQLTTGLQDVAIGSTPAAGHGIERAVSYLRSGTQIAGLGWNLWTAAQQPLGLFNGMARVGPKWVARGLNRWLRDARSMEDTGRWIASVSPMMRNRSNTATQDLHDLRKAFRTAGGWFDTAVRRVSGDRVTQRAIIDGYLWHIGLMQRVADMPTWLGQFEKSRAAGEPEPRAIALADQAVLDSQGGGQVKDLARVQRGGPFANLFMTFYSYGNTVFNATSRAVGKVKSPADTLGLLGELSLLYLMPAVASVALSRAIGKSGGDDDETTVGAFLEDVGQEMLATALNTMVLVRELGGLARDGVRGYAGPAGTRAAEIFYSLARQVEQGEADTALWHAANSAAGVLFRYPAGQVQRTVDGFVALEQGRTRNPLALLFGPGPAAKKAAAP